ADLVLVRVEPGAVRGLSAARVRGLEEAVAHARGLQPVDGGDVRVALARVAEGARGVVVVEAVAPLVVEDARDLARVPAAAAGAEEVDARAVPEGVARLVQVDVRGEALVEPGVRGQPAPRELRDAVQLVVGRAG